MAITYSRYSILKAYEDGTEKHARQIAEENPHLIPAVTNSIGSMGQLITWLENAKLIKRIRMNGKDRICRITPEGVEALKEECPEPRARGGMNTRKVSKKKAPAAEPEPRLNLSETANTVLESVALMANQNATARDFLSNLSMQIQREIDVTHKMDAPVKAKATKDKFMNDVNELHFENESLKYKLYQIHQLIES